ncbi:IS3 family transposase [Oribacterium sp. C9]|uniref:IS3 family transposase n=1 Tax=Oribacterium sp. C9 TaxID=1943579 RepID=UPI00143BD8A6|nr:IS3 family transposase [Oribacterium sp. C9]
MDESSFKYHDNNVKKLEQNPVVKTVDSRNIEFKLSFTIRLFERWKEAPCPETITMVLAEENILVNDVTLWLSKNINEKFLNCGYPRHKNRKEFENDVNYNESNPLILSGRFHRSIRRWGLEIDTEFQQELKKTYPNVSIETRMKQLGVNPLDVGYIRLRRLIHQFNSELAKEYSASEAVDRKSIPRFTTPSVLVRNPYVKTVDHGILYMTDAFYNEVYMLPYKVTKLLEIYGIEPNLVSEESLIRIHLKIKEWKPSDSINFSVCEEILKIQNRRIAAMHNAVMNDFSKVADTFKAAPIMIQRKICRWIDELPRDPYGYFTCKRIITLIGLSKSRYYALLNNKNYGMQGIRKRDQDEIDISVIRHVLNYKGFEKGIMQVYMLMPKITEHSFSIYRIRRLMNKYGIRTDIRRPSRNRKALRELMERNRKANLLMRRFKLHRPNEVRLTDVTYLDYGDEKRAYGSASVDPVTGRLICFIVSENNDLQLALDTLEAMDSHAAKSGAILHSDQGILYMTDDFQTAVVEKELTQSMSRRENCWDNAVQESFFGHFKDECHYEKCKTLKELQKCIDDYSFYYNNERGMWDRGRMTPTEYERFLEGMSEADFSDYLAREEKRFADMKVKSAEKAHNAAKSYKEFTEKSIGGLNNEAGGSFEEVQV